MTLLVFSKINSPKSTFAGTPRPSPHPTNQCCAAVVKGRRQQKVTQHCLGGEGRGGGGGGECSRRAGNGTQKDKSVSTILTP